MLDRFGPSHARCVPAVAVSPGDQLLHPEKKKTRAEREAEEDQLDSAPPPEISEWSRLMGRAGGDGGRGSREGREPSPLYRDPYETDGAVCCDWF